MTPYNCLISPDELNDIIDLPHVKIIDASMGVDMHVARPHIRGAIYFDIDDVADSQSPLPHTVPSSKVFEKKMRALGINQDDQIIVYDKTGVAMAACRVWWMFRLFGHDNVAVLNGGLPAWTQNNGEVEDSILPPPTQKGNFTSAFRQHLIRSAGQIKNNIDEQTDIVIDVRSPAHFAGHISDPRANNAAGHIPNSCNLPFISLLNERGAFQSEESIRATLENREIDLNENLVTSCGSGVTACVVALALFDLGKKDVARYDGSWTEWDS